MDMLLASMCELQNSLYAFWSKLGILETHIVCTIGRETYIRPVTKFHFRIVIQNLLMSLFYWITLMWSNSRQKLEHCVDSRLCRCACLLSRNVQ